MREIARELHVCFFGLQRPFSFLPRYDGLVDCGHSARSQANCRITKITRNVNVPCYDSLDERAHCARAAVTWQKGLS